MILYSAGGSSCSTCPRILTFLAGPQRGDQSDRLTVDTLQQDDPAQELRHDTVVHQHGKANEERGGEPFPPTLKTEKSTKA